MSVTATVPTPTTSTGAPTRRPRAVAVRRWFIVASPVLAGLFAVDATAAVAEHMEATMWGPSPCPPPG